MKKLLIIAGLVITFLLPNNGFAIRCGNDLIQIGDTAFQVPMKLKECGQVLNKYVARRNSSRSSRNKVELWHIRVEERVSAYCYPLFFESGILTKIRDWTECR
jgi:hypothetical protein